MLTQKEKLIDLFKLDDVSDYHLIETIIAHQQIIPFQKMAEQCVEKIIVKENAICIGLKVNMLVQLVSDGLGRKLSKLIDEEIIWLDVPYTAWKQKKGSIVIAPYKTSEDILDLPPEKLKKLVQGIIWRDEHFAGMTLKDIAVREKYSEAYVGTAIFMSFDHLSKALP